ncbi:hypothetical protein QYM36_000124 [Artemia franciscana]|uniref:Reverse transcriptase RNase H-like domain-containing protein n=1 Tax=Artemia franciscana TaxID=6661 RepID=A0AA88IKN6_ARTSF|nr:hypothetical protein QYM36_000124 [Artemia franciscana]
MEEAFENLNLGLIVDDIVICGADDSEHDERLKAALERAREKILRELARADEYKWKPAHEKAFSKIKSALCSNLAYFDPKCENIEVKVDASKHGLGAVLAVDDNVVAFGSRSMSETKQQYSQIEKELLAVVFGCKHFHQYIYGRTVTITTDHKPLESILVKPVSKAPPRLQRMMLSIQPYSLKFVYRPGSEIPVVDTLSRWHTPDLDNENEKQVEVFVHTLFKNLPIANGIMEKIRNATCTELRKLSQTIL